MFSIKLETDDMIIIIYVLMLFVLYVCVAELSLFVGGTTQVNKKQNESCVLILKPSYVIVASCPSALCFLLICKYN